MNILFDIVHPAYVHFLRNTIKILQNANHSITITARDKDVTLELLNSYHFPYITLSKIQKGFFGLVREFMIRQYKLYGILRKNKINLCVGVGGASCVHVARLLRIPCLLFADTEDEKIPNAINFPFAAKVITPDCLSINLGKKHIRYAGVQPLSYLHPNYFVPDPSIYDCLNIDKKEKYVLLRFVAWAASHDIGQKGMSLQLKRKIIQDISPHARIFIVSEGPLEDEFEQYRLSILPQRLHDVLYYATLCISESSTVVSECVCLGTPSIYVSSRRLDCIEEEKKYGLIFDLRDGDEIIAKVMEIMHEDNKDLWQERKNRFVNDKIDVTQWMTETILNYYHENYKNA